MAIEKMEVFRRVGGAEQSFDMVSARAARAREDALLKTLNDVYDALDNHYDGADDSPTRWMGEYLTKSARVIREIEATR